MGGNWILIICVVAVFLRQGSGLPIEREDGEQMIQNGLLPKEIPLKAMYAVQSMETKLSQLSEGKVSEIWKAGVEKLVQPTKKIDKFQISQMDFRPQSAFLIATLVVVNIIWWMVMIGAIALGATHLDHCPVQPHIPIYLIVLGASSILSLIFTYSTKVDGAVYVLSSACMTVLHIFCFAWLIAGTIWVYAVYPPNYSGTDRFCHKMTYLFAFVITTLMWVAVSFLFICGFCFSLLACCTTVVARHRLIPNRNTFYGATRRFQEPAVGDV